MSGMQEDCDVVAAAAGGGAAAADVFFHGDVAAAAVDRSFVRGEACWRNDVVSSVARLLFCFPDAR